MTEYALFSPKALARRPSWVEPTVRGLTSYEQAVSVRGKSGFSDYRIAKLMFGHWTIIEEGEEND